MSSPISAKRVVLTSFFVDLLDIILNITVAVITGSVIMVAELFQAFADLVSSTFLIIGLKRPKGEIYFWTILSALMMLLFASTLSIFFGYERYLHPEPIENIVLAYVALSVGAVSNGYAFYISARRILDKKSIFKLIPEFEKTKLVMTKNTFVLDLMGMSSATVGLVAITLYLLIGDLRFDGIGAMAIGTVLAFLSTRLIFSLVAMRQRKTGGAEI